MKIIKTLTIAIFVASSISSWAHSGGTDSNGCHTNRRTGAYHCH
ncbi:MAG: YHYH domain-containing protein [Burkholderiales bacterium]|nr:YHYH domain-containing protein [Burkholderiales bacterium]